MTIRCLFCPRCNRLCRATYQSAPIGVRDVFRAKGVLRAIGALVALALQDDIEPHDAPCGKPCGEGMFDGIARHTGLDCPDCKGRLG